MTAASFKQFVNNGKKILGVTTNYRSMLNVLKINKPEKPTIFMKPSTAYITEGNCIKIPKGFSVNQEIELGVIIGSTCSKVKEGDAMGVVAGYCVALDMTATCQLREAKSKGLPWLLGKGFDTSCPVSRFIFRDEIDSLDTHLWCSVNGTPRQSGNTEELIYSIPELIAYITQYVTLEQYDMVLTGTPPGMGPVKSGDVIEGGIKDIVTIKYHVQ